ncbi:MAG: Asp-tRNA(Asn)/Glu-tRNA(Gln) amidotransferase subunit GatB [Patescibacteria group bacterium]|nr:Asp-tRNA(Asn)/Glu-tRNA(Gln) amidotransferase subunit GatB [Patescibacteria group bacterium]
MKNYQPTIGLEIHAELKTDSKMFCNCKNDPFISEPNINICPICLGMPGTLPVINQKAVEWTILTGLALNCQILEATKWDRKNYFYPDLPKGYQISQYDKPIAAKGYLMVAEKVLQGCKQPKVTISNQNVTESNHKIRITRIHLEEDTGTLKHPEGKSGVDYSLVDYNRAGVPLMELVTEPDIETAREAKEFCQKYQAILRYLNVSDVDMEKGQMRCEANVSIRPISNLKSQSSKLGTKVEIKNLNSFKAVEKAINYEIKRQGELLDEGKKIIQETRGWDDVRGVTYSMRKKETSADYRYFPEPDLPPITIGVRGKVHGVSINIEEIKKQLPELPDQKLARYIKEYKLSENNAEILVNNMEMWQYFENIIRLGSDPILTSNWLINELAPDFSAKPQYIVELLKLIDEKKISQKIAKDLLPDIKIGKSPLDLIKTKGIEQISDTNQIRKFVIETINLNPDIVAKIKSGKSQAIGFLVGQVMKETKGQANPQIVSKIINEEIK